jgi:adenosylcobinamide-GDP ribazoletransferase
MKPLLAALQFLTICPVPSRFQCGEQELRRSVAFFPVVGLLLGGALAALDYGVGFVLPVLPASVVVIIAMLVVSGALHMDGLADTADGFLSSRKRERILEIMKDSRTGPMGAIAVVCVIVLKVAALVSVGGATRWAVVVLMPLAGRCALVVQMSVLSYARPEGGLASAFGKPRWAVAVALPVLLATAWWTARTMGLAAAGLSVLVTLLFSFWCRRKIGGFTGDTLGAACELAEIMPALVAAGWRWPQ